MTHSLLRRQLKRLKITEDTLPDDLEIWQELLRRVSLSYQQMDEDRYRLERSIDLSSEEMQELHTELKQSEEQARLERDRLKLIIESIGDGLCMVDPKGDIVLVNPSACRMLGWSEEEALSQNFISLVSQEIVTQEIIEQFISIIEQKISNGKPFQKEDMFARKDQSTFPVSYIVSPVLLQGELLGGVVVFRDMTERNRIRELQRATEAAEAANYAKTIFLATMSHELRTPLNAIIGYVGIILEGMSGEFDDSVGELLDGVLQSGRHLLSLIQDILDIAKIESNQFEVRIRTVDFPYLLEKWIAQFTPEMEAKGLEFEIDIDSNNIPLEIEHDDTRLTQIVTNLLNNALKFTLQGQIRFGVRVVHDNLLFEVEDTGIGIDEENLSLIFEAFRQVDQSYNRQYGGTGLGLAIVSKLCELLGGQITVKSSVGQGSLFTVVLPMNLSQEDLLRTMKPQKSGEKNG